MKTILASIAYFAAIMAVVWFGAGCATVGDGKLEPVTKATAKAALTAGAVAAPEYAAVLKRIQAQIEGYGEKAAQPDQLAGFKWSREFYYDGSPVKDPSRITWVDKWERTESAGDKAPPTSKTNAAVALDDADDALAAAIAELLADGE